MRQEYRERFTRHRGFEILAYITARAWPVGFLKAMCFLPDSGHVRAVMHAAIAN